MERNKKLSNLFLIFIGLLVCCKSNNLKKDENFPIDRLTYSINFIDSLLKEKKNCIEKKERIISYIDTINYVGEINEIFIKNDTITYIENLNGIKSISLFNNMTLRKHTLQDSIFNIDSMDLVLDLNLLEICYLKYNDNIIIVNTKPMNWVGTMTRYSFFQIINSKDKTVLEFIRDEE